MWKKTIFATTILSAFLIILSGCSTALGGDTTTSATPTIVSLSTETAAESTSTPEPTTTELPLPSPTLTSVPASPTTSTVIVTVAPTPSPVPVLPTPTSMGGDLAVVPQQRSAPVIEQLAPDTELSLSGSWDFSFGTMTLTQRDLAVEGTYQWYGGVDTGRIDGTLVRGLDQFRGLWISDRDPLSQQLMNWNVAADRTSFSGQTVGRSTSQQWCGVRSGQPLPADCGFSGDWLLRFGNPPGATGQATLVQTGQTVEGTYTNNAGETGVIIDGVITIEKTTEVKLNGIWRSDQGFEDTFEWRLDLTTGRTFQGRRDPGNSEWCGWRSGNDELEQCGWED